MKKVLVSSMLLAASASVNAQNVGINATGAAPVTSAALDVDIANKGILIPRVSLTTTAAFAPLTGTATVSLLVYNSATAGIAPNNVTPGYYYWNGTAWVRLVSSGTSWELLGNAGTVSGTNFLGTTDNVALDFRTNNTLRQRIFSTGETSFNSPTFISGDVLASYAAGANDAISGYATGSGTGGSFQNTGTGDALSVRISGTTAGAAGIRISNLGAGPVRGLEVLNTSGTTGTNISSTHSSTTTGRAGSFHNSSVTNTDVALVTQNSGEGRVINAQNVLTTSVSTVGFFLQASTGTTLPAFVNAASVWGQSAGVRSGVFVSSSTNAATAALLGTTSTTGNFNGVGVFGSFSPSATNGYGVIGQGNFFGVFANGNTGASGTKSFHIDHPLDPENKYLNHYSMESPEVLNMYRGNVVADTAGVAAVQLPAYFAAINRNISYVLTPIGGSASVYVLTEVDPSGVFTIAGANAGQKISWYVYAERNDAYLRTHPESRQVETIKDSDDKGFYLSPEAFGMPAEKGVFERFKVRPEEMKPVQMETPGALEK